MNTIDVDAIPLPAFGLSDEHPPFETDWHAHHRHQLLFAAEGSLEFTCEGRRWLLPPQRAAWICAEARHRVSAPAAVSLHTVYFDPDFPHPDSPCGVFALTPLAREMILTAMRWGPHATERERHAEHFFAALAGLYQEWAADPLPLALPVPRSDELTTAMSYALDNLSERPTLKEAARRAGVSSRTLTRRFRDETNTTWRSFLRLARIQRAHSLLAEPGAQVTQVAFAVGFESPSAFCQAFKQITGHSPGEVLRSS